MGCNKWGNDCYKENLTNMNGFFMPDQQRLGVDVTRGPGEHLYKVTVGPTTMLMLPDDALSLCEKLLYFFKAPPDSLAMEMAREVISITDQTGIPYTDVIDLVKTARGF
jgi:hypothetical protein